MPRYADRLSRLGLANCWLMHALMDAYASTSVTVQNLTGLIMRIDLVIELG